jgi:hypothetical protein
MPKSTTKARRAYRAARIDSYERRGQRYLATMLVDLEDSTDCEPEFLFTEWRAEQRANARAKRST